ncbi:MULTISPECIES: hypothetical protein [unclassified Curtobacterium]|uniref:hypothetical protein n=1 Tax=unclassified Curtobacterium TaxID=257496 RepID=UPI0008EBB64A|nr:MULTISPECIES: hypothetical protein [unclassified Curtobacterium]SFF56381.1 hypothetical protein SAMN05216329_1588 [Curtobacterium sp. YR515]
MGRRRLVLGGVVAAVLVAAGTATVLSVTHAQTVAARLPPASASSEQVLRVYLRAAKAHDCAVTEALTDDSGGSDTAWCGGRTPSSWFDDHPDLLGYRHIGAVSRLSAKETGRAAEECIPVDVTETNMTGAEPGVLPGWQFCFRHTPAGWRLTDEGYG